MGILALQRGEDVNASYDVPYIERKVTSEYNETVAHEYQYSNSLTDPFDAEAEKQIVGLENIGEVWLNDNDGGPFKKFLDVEAWSKFQWFGAEGWTGVDLKVSKWLL